jgi:hypothetical protein
MTDRESRLKVLSVVGAGRSGTTILGSILNEVDGFATAGELRWLWERGVVAERPCGCGAPPHRCPVWSQVINDTLGGHFDEGETTDRVRDIIAAQHEVGRPLNLPRALRSIGAGAGGWKALGLVSGITDAACASFARTTGARVVVDISKRPIDAAVFAGLDDVDHYVVHIVRDPRAVVHAWQRSKQFTVSGQAMSMGRRGLLSTTRRWVKSALSAAALRRRVPQSRWFYLRYEDFAAEPRLWVDRMLAFMGESGPTTFSDDHTAVLGANHIVAGNPSRFETGPVAVRADDEWRRRLPRRSQLLVALLTMPLLRRFGYVGRHDGKPQPQQPAAPRSA